MEQSLANVVGAIIDKSADQDHIMPSWIANAAFLEMDPEQVTPARVKIAALQSLKQLARQLLRGKFEPNDDADAMQHEIWPDLQQRYPVVRTATDDEPTYVKLELLNEVDVAWNVSRLRSEANTKIKHARALEQWGRERGLLAA